MRNEAVIGPAVVMVLILCPWFLVLDPMLARRTALLADVEHALGQQNQLALRVSELERGSHTPRLDPALVWQDDAAGAATTEIQQILIGMSRQQGLGYRSLGSGPTVPLGNYRRVSVSLEADGYLEQIAAIIAELEAHRPALRIARMTVRHAPRFDQDRTGTPVSLSMEVWGVAQAEAAD